MGLKSFHKIFILISILTFLYIAKYHYTNYSTNANMENGILTAVFIFISILLVLYLGFFNKFISKIEK